MSRFRFFTGSYTDEDLVPGSRGEGIQLWELHSQTGALELISTFSAVSNPSWVTVAPDRNLIAAASEHVDGKSRICLLDLEPDGTLALLDSIPSGDATCHVSFSPDSRFLAAAAYMEGQVHLAGIRERRFTDVRSICSYRGGGPDTARQESPHAHQVIFSPDGTRLFVTDLGTDQVWRHSIRDGILGEAENWLPLPPGEGPRHMVLDKKGAFVHVLAELTGKIHHFSRVHQSNTFSHAGSVSSIPADASFTPSSAAIHPHPDGSRLYVSNRNGGHVSAFAIDPINGGLHLTGIFRVADPSPRDFQISPDGAWLIVAGQSTSRLYIYPLDAVDGSVGPLHSSVACGSPVCLAWSGAVRDAT